MHRLVVATLLLMTLLSLYSWLASLWIERRYPPSGAFIEVDGLRLHYVVAGQGPGPAVLLVHGASSNLREFTSSILPLLARHHRVIAFDRPGYGHSEHPRGPWRDPAAVAALLLDACRQLGIDKPAIVGHSWAGSVVMSALVHMPQRVHSGVLLSGVAGHWAGSVGWTYDLGGTPLLGPLFAWTALMPAGQLLLEKAVAPVLSPMPMPAAHVQEIAAPLALRPRTFTRNAEDMTRLNAYMQSLSPRYDQIRLPLLIIHGTDDQLVPFWNHGRRLLPVIPQAQLRLIEGAGHAPHHSHPELLLAALEQFLGGHRVDSP